MHYTQTYVHTMHTYITHMHTYVAYIHYIHTCITYIHTLHTYITQNAYNAFNSSMGNLKVYYLDVLSFRNISNEVSQTYKVVHQSPQLLIIKNETVVVHASHHDIVQVQIASYL